MRPAWPNILNKSKTKFQVIYHLGFGNDRLWGPILRTHLEVDVANTWWVATQTSYWEVAESLEISHH